MITDTRKVWAEVMTSVQLARRWRATNGKAQSLEALEDEQEDSWREARLGLLGKAHSLAAFPDMSFEVVPTRYSDLAVRIEAESFGWVWQTTFVGYRMSAELLSQHLILPMISVVHFTLGGQESLVDMPDDDLEKVVDKVARTARRTQGTHVRNAIAKPRAATCLSRMSAMLNFTEPPPRIVSTAEKPDLTAPEELSQDTRREVPRRAPPSSAKKPSAPLPARSPSPPARSPPPQSRGSPIEVDSDSPAPAPRRTLSPPPAAKTSDAPADDSVTESSTDDEDAPPPKKAVAPSSKGKAEAPKPASRRFSPLLSSSPSPPPSLKAKLAAEGSLKPASAKPSSSAKASTTSRPASSAARAGSSKLQAQGSKPAPKARVVNSSDSDSPAPPPKRTRTESSSDDDQPTRRGTRQPLRRGRKRF
ncbi:hypothetical protein EV122DRAFT_293013 [Schizophyllum commune]